MHGAGLCRAVAMVSSGTSRTCAAWNLCRTGLHCLFWRLAMCSFLLLIDLHSLTRMCLAGSGLVPCRKCYPRRAMGGLAALGSLHGAACWCAVCGPTFACLASVCLVGWSTQRPASISLPTLYAVTFELVYLSKLIISNLKLFTLLGETASLCVYVHLLVFIT